MSILLDKHEDARLKRIFGSVICGYSIAKLCDKNVFVQHSSAVSELSINSLYENTYNDFVRRGDFTEKEQLELLCRDNFWSDKKEAEINDLYNFIDILSENKRKSYSRKDINSYNDQIVNARNDLVKLITERTNLIGPTAEIHARRKSDEYLIQQSFFVDRDCKVLLYNDIEFENLDSEQLNQLYTVYSSIIEDFSDTNLKKVAIQNFFHDMYYMADNIVEFYGNCVARLTHYQIRLAAFGNMFKNILSENPPDEAKRDPQSLEDWGSGKRNIDEIINKNDKNDGVVSIGGVTNDDLKFYGVDTGGIDHSKVISEKTKKFGGEMSLQQMVDAKLI